MARVSKRGREWGRAQVAAYLGIGERMATRLMEEGKIKAELRNGEWRTIQEACDMYLFRLYLEEDDLAYLSRVFFSKVLLFKVKPDESSNE